MKDSGLYRIGHDIERLQDVVFPVYAAHTKGPGDLIPWSLAKEAWAEAGKPEYLLRYDGFQAGLRRSGDMFTVVQSYYESWLLRQVAK